MGLCKCRVVTSLFCFQHTANVCEKCIVTDHPKCVVKTYLKWLHDSEYDANCQLCKTPLDDGRETLRLPCLDVFHWECINRYAEAFPATTAPAGYRCPVCQSRMLPDENNASPVAQIARQKIMSTSWGNKAPTSQPATAAQTTAAPTAPTMTANQSSRPALASHAAAMPTTVNTPLLAPLSPGNSAMRRSGPEFGAVALDIDHFDSDENKYARRPAGAWLSQTLSNRLSGSKGLSSTDYHFRRAIILLIIGIVALITVIELLTRARPSAEGDPLLDPDMNPHLRTE